jgi:aminoglycoside phosphotransferase (APT) family kinase protein
MLPCSGYTNSTTRDGGLVRKTYQGPDALHRAKSERLALRLLAGRIPVPVVVDGGDTTSLTMQFVEGEHGQELIDAGKAEHVLRACGGVLARLHAIDVSTVYPGTHAKGLVIRHGDFGPNNVLLSSETLEITAVLDWEFSGPGRAIEDPPGASGSSACTIRTSSPPSASCTTRTAGNPRGPSGTRR